ncbi:MAG: hypoxanthine phosphoribosyltransferase [Nitrospirae bacterium]|nr:MAG: hypoxanthine phosphoribosyltransferase [Nitrospirota bacterium]
MIIGKPFITAQQIHDRVKELADEISGDYEGKDIIAIGILRGAFMFFSDLVRMLKMPVAIDFLIASSYAGTTTTGNIKIHADIREDIRGKDVLLVEDIVDTGITMDLIRKRMLSREPASLKICTLLDKAERRIKEVPLDYVGFKIPDKFVVGYGLDYEGKYRNLPYISIFKEKR